MKIALVTTTINVPHVLALYRACPPAVAFLVAMDEKTPQEAYDFCKAIPDCFVYSPDHGAWKCSSLIGNNTVARRSIAILEALRWGAEIIVTTDDDNFLLSSYYFYNFEKLFSAHHPNFHGLQSVGDWFDPGLLLAPPASHRGFPHDKTGSLAFEPVVGAKVGVAAGLVLGDPDVSAATRIALKPTVLGVSELGRAGIVVDPRKTRTVFNSQNTAFVRELAPCFLMCPQFGRYDDILASLAAQRVMRERGYVVHYGKPFAWQQRNSHDLLKDLAAEQWGQEHLVAFAGYLDSIEFAPGATVSEMVHTIWHTGRNGDLLAGTYSLADAWLEDCARAMS